MDYDLERCSRRCAISGRELSPGEDFFSALVMSGRGAARIDYAAEAWSGPPEGALGWWKSRLPLPEEKPKKAWAPAELMLDLFDRLGEMPDRADARFVLALLLVRRRVLRIEESEHFGEQERLLLSCPRRHAEYEVIAAAPDEERAHEIQAELETLLQTEASA
jgi:hypothetical protein